MLTQKLNAPKSIPTLTRHVLQPFSSTIINAMYPKLSIPSIHNQINDFISNGLYEQILQLYKHLHNSSHFTAISILPSVIKACSSTQFHPFGLQLHSLAIKTGSGLDVVVSNSLISMYAKHFNIKSASQVFDIMPYRDTVTWNAMMNCCIQNGCWVEAFKLLNCMHVQGFVAKPELLASILSVCGRMTNFRLGTQAHALVIADGRIKDSVFLPTALIDLYFKCGDTVMASCVFDQMEMKNEVSWTAMISGYTANRNYDAAFELLRAMQDESVKPNRVTLVTLLPACAKMGYIKHGREIHGHAIRKGFDSNHQFAAALLYMYSVCRKKDSRPVKLIFSKSVVKDVVSWSSIIASYSQRGEGSKALKLFNQMRAEEIEPNSITFLALISACTTMSSLKYGGGIHGLILKAGFNSNILVGNAIVNMYSKCGCLADSHKAFSEMPAKDIVSWSSMINAYGIHGRGKEALQLLHEMRGRGMQPDEVTFLSALSACNHAGLVNEGKGILGLVEKDHEIAPTIEHYACQVDLLGRSGKLEEAFEVVRTMPMKPNTRIWSNLASACKVQGILDVAEKLAKELIKSEPDNATNYTLLNMIYAENENWLDIEKVRRAMRLKRLKKRHGFSRIELRDEIIKDNESHFSLGCT